MGCVSKSHVWFRWVLIYYISFPQAVYTSTAPHIQINIVKRAWFNLKFLIYFFDWWVIWLRPIDSLQCACLFSMRRIVTDNPLTLALIKQIYIKISIQMYPDFIFLSFYLTYFFFPFLLFDFEIDLLLIHWIISHIDEHVLLPRKYV